MYNQEDNRLEGKSEEDIWELYKNTYLNLS